MKIVIAPNAFKNSLSADEVAAALREGILLGGFSGELVCCPVGDGGDGTGRLLSQYLGAEILFTEVNDPLQRPIKAPFGWVQQTGTAIIEMADASGLRLLHPDEYDPLVANTAGCGQLVKAALDKEAAEVLLCVGGSATVDGATGMLKELGLRFRAADGALLKELPADLKQLRSIDVSGLDPRLPQVKMTILCDVKNHLLGSRGAAAVFGPQKGADANAVAFLETALQQLQQVIKRTTGIDINALESGGAAGGVAATLPVFCKAVAVDGTEYFLNKIGFDQQLKDADWVITGEGTIDRQTLDGKAPYGVAQRAGAQGIPVIGVAGKVPEAGEPALDTCFHRLLSINEQQLALEEAIRETRPNLVRAGIKIGTALQNNIGLE